MMERNSTAQPLLEVKHLSVDYAASNGTVHAVNNVSFTLHRGEVLGLAGESGSGKSTLAYAISRLLRPPALIAGGQVVYHPRLRADQQQPDQSTLPVDVLDLTSEELRTFRWNELAIVFQSAMNALNPVMTVGAQIMDVLKTHRPNMSGDARKQRAIELLGLVGIAPDRLKSYPHELSGGMRQRAVIAIALALNPEIIIMDEPTTALDVVVQREILTEILRLRELLHFSVIFITHDLSLLIEMADTIAIMYAGRIVEQGSQRDLYLRPRHPYSYGLIHSFPTLHGPRRRALGIPGSPPDLRAVPPGCAFHPRCPLAFSACTIHLPLLRSLPVGSDSESDQQAACHLYNPQFTTTFPTPETIAAQYENLAERSGVR